MKIVVMLCRQLYMMYLASHHIARRLTSASKTLTIGIVLESTYSITKRLSGGVKVA